MTGQRVFSVVNGRLVELPAAQPQAVEAVRQQNPISLPSVQQQQASIGPRDTRLGGVRIERALEAIRDMMFPIKANVPARPTAPLPGTGRELDLMGGLDMLSNVADLGAPAATKAAVSKAGIPLAALLGARATKAKTHLKKSDIEVVKDFTDTFVRKKGDRGTTLPGKLVDKSDLPDVLFHVSGASRDIEKSGVLRAAGDESFGKGGLGKGQTDKSVSLTASREKAELIRADLVRHGQIARAEVSGDFENWLRGVVERDASLGGLDADALSGAWRSAVGDFRKRVEMGREKPRDILESFRIYLNARDYATQGVLENPFIFVNDMAELKRLTDASVGIVSVARDVIPEDAVLRRFKGLDEVMVHADLPVGKPEVATGRPK